jgi:PAS domain S-box-containing protein
MGAGIGLLAEFGDDFAWSLLDAVPDGILMATTSGEIVYVNEQLTSLFGGTTAELLGRQVDDLLPEELRGAHRAHRNRYRAHLEVRSMGADRTLRARRLDGSEFHTEISLSPLRLGQEQYVLAAVRDVSDRIAAEDHFRRVLVTLDASDDGVFMFDAASLRYTYVNEGAVRMVGYGRDDLFQMTPLDLNPYATEEEYRGLVDRLLAEPDDHVHRESSLLRKDGTEIPVDKTFRAAPTARDGSRWIIASARDISDRLEGEALLREQDGALREAEQAILLAADRDRIARDLHDTVIQRLFGTGLGLQSLMATVGDPARGRLEQAIDDLDDTIRELRSAIFSLQSASSKDAPAGIRRRVVEMVTDVGNDAGFESQMRFEGAVESIHPMVAEELLPTIREALSNVAKHANAHEVSVRLKVDDSVTLTVVDDGTGAKDDRSGGHGLLNMLTRAQNLGGHSELRSPPEGGSVLTWSVPAEPAACSGD